MQSLGYIIVKADQDYNNEIEVAGTKIVVNATIESIENINREATVVTTPEGTVLLPGDTVIIHHNIMRRKNNTMGKEVKSPFFIKDDLYYVPPTEVFAYKRKGQDWKALDPYCFIEPIYKEEKKVGNLVVAAKAQEGYKGREDGIGTIKYINKELEEQEDLKVGDKVHFTPYSEYEFEIEGKILYKMNTQDILANITC